MTQTTKRLLSIQSHVVHGYVGNKCATFPLQYNGWHVDAINTVQFSNHPGYKSFTGYKCKTQEICDILKNGLIDSLAVDYDVILTGYFGDSNSLKEICNIISQEVESLKTKWVIDPVLGDEGRLYVSDDTIDVYKNILKSYPVFLVTPNQFEFELLTGSKVESLESLRHNVAQFYKLYPQVQNLVITSISFNDTPGSKGITAFSQNKSNTIHCYDIPMLPAKFNGSGDLFTALLIDRLIRKSNGTLEKDNSTLSETAFFIECIGYALTLVHKVLSLTLEITLKENNSTEDGYMYVKDLKIIESRHLFEYETLPLITKPYEI